MPSLAPWSLVSGVLLEWGDLQAGWQTLPRSPGGKKLSCKVIYPPCTLKRGMTQSLDTFISGEGTDLTLHNNHTLVYFA